MHIYKYVYSMHRRMQLLVEQMVKSKKGVGSKGGDITTLDFKKSIVEKLSSIAKKNATSTRKYGMDLVTWNVAKFDLMTRIFPFLSKDHVGGKSVFINDHRVNDSTIEVRLEYSSHDGKDNIIVLKCLHCQKNDCEHVMFALMLPELGQLALDNKISDTSNNIKKNPHSS
jgi:hypothetical protein